jgi:succinylarginine dihydrolase
MDEPIELNLDGLVGPTHHYGGLARGNLASQAHRHVVASPKAAALEGLDKMKLLSDMGLPQAVLPPQPRPALSTLRVLGFTGSDAQVVAEAHREAPDWLHSVYSASSMWAANAATLTPSADSGDGRMHVTPANLISQFHRCLEPDPTATILKKIFANTSLFAHHGPLPATWRFADEGAANHLRLALRHGEQGVHVFVFGYDPTEAETASPYPGRRFRPRQSAEAARAMARQHGLQSDRLVLAQQHPDAVDAGVFHNDVISLANEHVLLYHEQAFAETPKVIERICHTYRQMTGGEPVVIEVPAARISLATAVATYLFNSQLITRPDGGMLLLCPDECRQDRTTATYLDELVARADNPIDTLRFINVRQSMHNGGGPACLRLRAVLTKAQYAAMHPGVKLDQRRYDKLRACVEAYWPESLSVADLADPALIDHSRAAMNAARQTLDLPPLL